jgi:hypothetical protein
VRKSTSTEDEHGGVESYVVRQVVALGPPMKIVYSGSVKRAIDADVILSLVERYDPRW